MGHIIKKGGKNPEKGDIMFGAICGDRFLQSITWRRSFPRIHESNPKKLGVYKAEVRKIPYHGNFEGTV